MILEFTSYIPANNKIQIRAVDVKRFGLDSSPNHSVVDKDTFLLPKNPLGQALGQALGTQSPGAGLEKKEGNYIWVT